MKAILVIDMPKTCNDCPMMAWDDEDNWLGCHLTNRQTGVWSAQAGRPVDCPLKPMPKQKDTSFNEAFMQGYKCGWNACLCEELIENE